MGYVKFPIESNPILLQQQAFSYIKSRSPTWTEFDGNLDTWIIQVLASQASDLRVLASDVPDAIFRYFGDTILGIPPNSATQAIVESTWTAIDDRGYLITAGTLVGIDDGGGAQRGFRVLNDVSILPGLTTTDIGEVSLMATEAGTASTNIGAADIEVELIDPLDFVESVTLAGTSAGGSDAETIDEYTNRLSEFMRSLSTRPILADDYARLAKNQAGVYRAIALDGYNPADDTYFNDKMVAIAAVDQFGLDLPDETKENLDTLMQGMREVNFVINIIDASRTTIDVNFEAKAIQGYSTTEVEAACIADVTDYLRPANWGFDKSILTSGTSSTWAIITQGAARSWTENQFIYYNEVMAVLSDVRGVDHVVDMTMNRASDPPGRANIALDLPAALTEPGNIDGLVT